MTTDSRVRLRALDSSDLAFTRQWRNDEGVSDLALGRPFPVTDADEERWFATCGAGRWPSEVVWMVTAHPEERAGLVMLTDIDWISRRANFGVWIAVDLQRQGIGHAASELALDQARRRFGLHKVSLRVRADHDAARAMYSEIGFVDEGVLRDEVFVDGSFHDVVVMAIRWASP